MTSPAAESEPCAFCAIARGEDRTIEIVCEDESWTAFFPLEPATPGHTLVIPRTLFPTSGQLQPPLIAELMTGVRRVGEAISAAINPEGMNVITSS